MIFTYTASKEDKRALRKQLDSIRERDGHITTLSIGRMQGLQYGHKKILDFAEEIGDKNILALGSTQVSGTFANPFTASQRIEMIRMVKGYDKRHSGKMSVVKLTDIGAKHISEWRDYVLNTILSYKGIQRPNVYISGSELDIIDNGFHDEEDILAISLDRLNSGIMSGTEVRKSIINGNDIWKDHVPYVLHSYMEENFPEELTLESQIKTNS